MTNISRSIAIRKMIIKRDLRFYFMRLRMSKNRKNMTEYAGKDVKRGRLILC